MASRLPLLLLLACAVALGWILQPFWGAILWAVIIALLFLPMFRRLLPRVGGRRSLAAALVLGAVLLICVLPLTLVAASLAREAATLYQQIDSGAWQPELAVRRLFNALPGWVVSLLDHFGVADFDTLQRRMTASVSQAAQLITTRALGIGLDTFDFFTSLAITLYLAFFLVRDGESLVRTMAAGLPLSAAHQRALGGKFATVVRATVKGSLLVAAAQGALGGLAFWVLGVQGALLWAVLMTFLSLVPAVGAALVWAPVAAWFALHGEWAAAAGLTAWGVLVIGLVDNLLRPILVGKDTRLPDYVVMIATLGGIFFGTLLALMRLSGKKWLDVPATIYVNGMRSIPLVMVILWFFLLVPAIIGRPIGAEVSAVITFIAFEAAYFSEIMRAGIQSIPRGQVYAGQALGMTYGQNMKLVVLPQAFRNMLPVLLTQTIILFQDTSLVYAIGAYDLLKGFVTAGKIYGRPEEAYLMAAVLYFVVCFGLSALVKRLQNKIAIIR